MAWTKQPDGTTIWVPQEQSQSNLSRATGQGLNSLGSALSNFFKPNQQQQAFFKANTDTGTMGQPSSSVVSTAKNYFPSSTSSNPTQTTSSELAKVMGSRGTTSSPTRLTDAQRNAADTGMFNAMGGATGFTPTSTLGGFTDAQRDATDTGMFNATGGAGGGGAGGGGAGGFTSGVITPRFNPTASTTDWTAKLAGVTASGKELNQKTLDALKENINTQYTEQLKAIQTQAKQGQLAEQQARQQIAEAAFTRERQLLEAASQRGLGGSGIEQLSRVQQRAVVGQQINQLAQQTGLQREQLTNALSQAAAAKNAALTQAEINALTTQLQIDQADFQQGLSLDDRNRAQAYQKFQADLASAEFTNQTEYIQWQKDNAKEQARLLGVRNKQDVLAVLADPNASEDFKKAWIKLNLDAGFITEQEATEWGTKNLKSVNPEELEKLIDPKVDYTSDLAKGAIKLFVQDVAVPSIAQYFIESNSAKNLNWKYTGTDGKVYIKKGSELIDKNNPESPLYAFKDLPGYSVKDPRNNGRDIIDPLIIDGKIKFGLWDPEMNAYRQIYETFSGASKAYEKSGIFLG